MQSKALLIIAGTMLCLSALAAGDRYVLGVKGVACPYCAYGVEKRLYRIEGVTEVQVDIGDSVIRVTMAEGTSLTEAKARKAVEEAGFTLDSFAADDASRREGGGE